MNYKKEKHAIPYLIIFCILALGLLVYVEFSTDLQNFLLYGDNAEVIDFSTGWKTDDGKTVDLDDVTTGHYGGSVHLTATVPDKLPEGAALCLVSRNADITLSVLHSGEYKFQSHENLTGYGYGIAFHTYVLCPESAGKELSLDLKASLKEAPADVSEM